MAECNFDESGVCTECRKRRPVEAVAGVRFRRAGCIGKPAPRGTCHAKVAKKPPPPKPKPELVEFTFDCEHRGDRLGIIENCGCGGGRNAEVAVCRFKLEDGSTPHPFCVPRTLGARAGWAKVQGVTELPAGCTVCEHRPDGTGVLFRPSPPDTTSQGAASREARA